MFRRTEIRDVMRRELYIFCAALLMSLALSLSGTAHAQNIPIGKRIPDVRPQEWLNGERPVREAKLTCIEFFHPSSKRSRTNLEHLKFLAGEFLHRDFQVVVIAAGDEETVRTELTPYTDEGLAVGLDTDNACFKAFGVTYLPACVIIDEQKRTIWTGDSKLLTQRLINDLKHQ